jgi:hypothetical protein
MYINAVANSVMLQLYLRHDFCNTVFKIKYKLYIASRSAAPPPFPAPSENSGCTCYTCSAWMAMLPAPMAVVWLITPSYSRIFKYLSFQKNFPPRV